MRYRWAPSRVPALAMSSLSTSHAPREHQGKHAETGRCVPAYGRPSFPVQPKIIASCYVSSAHEEGVREKISRAIESNEPIDPLRHAGFRQNGELASLKWRACLLLKGVGQPGKPAHASANGLPAILSAVQRTTENPCTAEP